MSKPRTVREQAKAVKAVALYLSGYTKKDAYMAVHPKSKDIGKGDGEHADNQIHKSASTYFKKPLVLLELNKQAATMQVSALDSHVKYHTDLQEQIAAAIAENNWTAVGALMRLRGQSGTYIRESVSMTSDGGMSTEKLLKQIAELAPDVAVAVRTAYGLGNPEGDGKIVPITKAKSGGANRE